MGVDEWGLTWPHRGPRQTAGVEMRAQEPSTMNQPIRVLVVEDSVVQRKILRSVLEDHPDIEVVGHARNGQVALNRIEQGGVDVITLDLEMPVMGGIEVLKRLQAKPAQVGAIVVSAHSEQGARAALEAMRLGAFDLICKPTSGHGLESAVADLKRDLLPRVLACGAYQERRHRRAAGNSRPIAPGAALARRSHSGVKAPELIVLGSSTGGPQALDAVLPLLPASLPVPILVVQHMPPIFTHSLAESLDRKCELKVSEAQHCQVAGPGEVLIAPGGKQMKFLRNIAGELSIRITDDPPEKSCKPSVDYLFRCAAEIMADTTLAVIMTGMGDDGSDSLKLLKSGGARIIAQNEATCVVFGMPRLAVTLGLAEVILPVGEIAGKIQSWCCGAARSRS